MRSQAYTILTGLICVLVMQYGGCQEERDYSGDLFADYQVLTLGLSVDLHCNNTSQESYFRPNNTNPVSWMLTLPDLNVTYESQDKYEISNNNWTLTVHNTSTDDFGQYHCMLLNPEGEWYLVTVGLNVKGPYFEDLWKKYDMPVLIAFCALGGFLLIAAILILLYVFRYQSDDDDDSDSSSDSHSSTSSKSSRAPAAVLGVKSVPAYTPYNAEDGDVIPAKSFNDGESKSSKTSGHSSKVQDNGTELTNSSAESSQKLNGHSDDSMELHSVGKENKAFEADPEDKGKLPEGVAHADIHSSDSSSVTGSLDSDKEFTTM